MKRFMAACIDFCINYLLGTISFFIIISIYKNINNYLGGYSGDVKFIKILLVYLIVLIFTIFVYSIIFDILFKGVSPGKKITGYRIMLIRTGINYEYKYWVIYHALLKTVSVFLYPITLIYYFIMFQMPYDKLLVIESSTNEKELSYLGKSDNKSKNKKLQKNNNETFSFENINKKRLIALIIDVLVIASSIFVIVIFIGLITMFDHRYMKIVYFITSYMVFFVWLEFLMFDYFGKGRSLGKRLVGIQLIKNDKKFSFLVCLMHSFLKTISCVIYPVSLIYFVIKGKMFYDDWLNLITIEIDKIDYK